MKKLDNTNKKTTVSLSNELIRAAHNLKLVEKRVLMLAISRLDTKAALTGRNQLVTLTVSDYLKEFSAEKESSYREIAKAVESIDATRVKFKNILIGEYGTIHWTTGARYKPKEGIFSLSINGDLMPYLQDLKSHFTTYKLHRVSGLRSVYSWRLFELLMQFKSTGLLSLPIEDFHHAMESPESLRANFANLRNRIIEPAVKEIREKDGLTVAWEAIKAGRKVAGLTFTFSTEQPIVMPLADKSKRQYTQKSNAVPTPVVPNPKNTPTTNEISRKDALSRLVGLQNMAKLSHQSLELLASPKELETFKKYGLI